MSYYLKIYGSASDLPESWTSIVGKHNILLSVEYFRALQKSLPSNMECFIIGFFNRDALIGGAVFQYLDFISYKGAEKNKITLFIKNLFARIFLKDTMILGNNMLTGQNGFYFDLSKISSDHIIMLLDKAVQKMQNEIRKTSLVVCKDYQQGFADHFEKNQCGKYFRFSVQPDMKLEIKEHWKTFDDYVNDFSKKYRARVRTAKKKLNDIEKIELNQDLIKKYQQEMNALYQYVVENATFNTFFLAENHFEKMKENLAEKFKVFGYFSEMRLVGFYTLILNNNDVNTYFLGYDKSCQKEKQVYLNMLLDMVKFGINHRFKTIIFGRTALEIKSTIGAEPTGIYVLMKHRNGILNKYIGKIFTSFAPKTEWIQRKPFK